MLCMFKVLWELTSDRIDFSNATNGTYISDVKMNISLLITGTRRTRYSSEQLLGILCFKKNEMLQY